MLILLPPSEGKTAPSAGPALDIDSLSCPQLAPQRRKVLDALGEVSARADALDVLGVGQRLTEEVRANTRLAHAPTARAAEVYTGVLYAAAGFDSADLPAYALTRLRESVRIVSALWGVVSPLDLIPAYRLAMGVKLPGLGSLPQLWREPLDEVLGSEAHDGVVIDCRSAGYVAAWRPAPGRAWVSVKVLRELDGKRAVVSHNAKHARGLLAGHLVTRRGSDPATANDVLTAARELVGDGLLDAQLLPAARGGHNLELIVA